MDLHIGLLLFCTVQERRKLMATAKAIVPTTCVKSETVTTPITATPPPKPVAPSQPIGSRRRGGSTRGLGQHSKQQGVLQEFNDWLRTVDGKEKSLDQGKQITVDGSKYLFLQMQTAEVAFAYNPAVFNGYFSKLQQDGMRPAGLLVKIPRLRTFLNYLSSK